MSESPLKDKTTGTEARTSPRYDSERFMKFVKEGGSGIISFSQVINVSEGGLLFTSRQSFASRTRLELQFPPTHEDKGFSLKAEVVWNRELPRRQGAYYTGVRFIETPKDSQMSLLNSISKEFIITRSSNG